MAEAKETKETPAEDKKSLAQAYYEGKAEQSARNLAASSTGKEVEINIVNTRLVRFTKDFGQFLKKGHVQAVSDAAYEIYSGQGVIEVIN